MYRGMHVYINVVFALYFKFPESTWIRNNATVEIVEMYFSFQERTISKTWGIRAKKAKEAAEDAAVVGKK